MANKSDTNMYCLMSQIMYLTDRYINNKEERNTAIILTRMSENIEANKQDNKVEYSQVNVGILVSVLSLIAFNRC